MIESLANSVPQFINIELIIIDDNSNDKTLYICEQLKTSYDFINVYKNQSNGKVAGTLQGLSYVSKDWVKCIDGDDFVDLSKLTLDNFCCDAFYHYYFRYSSSGSITYVRTSKDLAKLPHKWNYNLRSIPKGMFFFKRSIFDDEDFEQLERFSYEDAFINFIISKNSVVIKKIDSSLYYYRQHNDNFYGDIKRNANQIERMRSELEQNYALFRELYPNYPINSKLPHYFNALKGLSIENLFSLLFEPKLLIKAIAYRVRSRL